MLDGLKKFLGLTAPKPDARRPPPPGEGGERPPRWEKKAGQKVRWLRKSPAPLFEAPEEQICPGCGKALLAEWGTNCPRCKPRIAMARTMALTRGQRQAEAGMILGWLVVLKSPDEAHRGELIELEEPVTLLSRSMQAPIPGVSCHAFEDDFMSTRHAAVRRPFASLREAAFAIEDRRDPAGPSANGVFVNARRIPPDRAFELSDGDIIRLGTTELQFKSLLLPPGGGSA
jgi:hypothetical protein